MITSFKLQMTKSLAGTCGFKGKISTWDLGVGTPYLRTLKIRLEGRNLDNLF